MMTNVDLIHQFFHGGIPVHTKPDYHNWETFFKIMKKAEHWYNVDYTIDPVRVTVNIEGIREFIDKTVYVEKGRNLLSCAMQGVIAFIKWHKTQIHD
jgi:hypothetical protein